MTGLEAMALAEAICARAQIGSNQVLAYPHEIRSLADAVLTASSEEISARKQLQALQDRIDRLEKRQRPTTSRVGEEFNDLIIKKED